MNALEAVQLTSDWLNDPENRTWQKGQILRFLSTAQNRFTAYARTISENFMLRYDPAFLAGSDFTLDSGSPDIYRAPFDSVRYQAIDALFLIRGGKRFYIPRAGETTDYRHEPYDVPGNIDYDVLDGGNAQLRFEVYGASIVLYGSVQQSDVFAAEYPAVPGSLFVAPANAASGSSITVLYSDVTYGLIDRWDGAYDDMFLQATINAGHAMTPNPVASYATDATKGTFTLKFPVAAISPADEIAPALALPAESHRAIILMAAVAAAISRGSHKLAQGLQAELAAERQAIEDAMHQRKHSSRRVQIT